MAHDSIDPKVVANASAYADADAADSQEEIDKLKAAMLDKLGCLKTTNEARINTAEAIARKARESFPNMVAVKPKPLDEAKKQPSLTGKFAAFRGVGR